MKVDIEDIIIYFSPVCPRCLFIDEDLDNVPIQLTLNNLCDSGQPICQKCGELLELESAVEMKMTERLERIRTAVGDLISSSGCGCCRDYDRYKDSQKRLGHLLDVPMYEDESGYNFYKFMTPRS